MAENPYSSSSRGSRARRRNNTRGSPPSTHGTRRHDNQRTQRGIAIPPTTTNVSPPGVAPVRSPSITLPGDAGYNPFTPLVHDDDNTDDVINIDNDSTSNPPALRDTSLPHDGTAPVINDQGTLERSLVNILPGVLGRILPEMIDQALERRSNHADLFLEDKINCHIVTELTRNSNISQLVKKIFDDERTATSALAGRVGTAMTRPSDDADLYDEDDDDDDDEIVRSFQDNLAANINLVDTTTTTPQPVTNNQTPLAHRHADQQPGSQARWSAIHADRARGPTAPGSTTVGVDNLNRNNITSPTTDNYGSHTGHTSHRTCDTTRRNTTTFPPNSDGSPTSRWGAPTDTLRSHQHTPRGAGVASPPTTVPIDMRQSTLDNYARSHLINRKDIGRLAELHGDYHGSSLGFPRINERDLADAGYKFTHHFGIHEAAICYNDLIFIHNSMVSAWPDPRDPSKGPQVHRIITKSLTAFPQLHSTSGRAVVEFYDKMQVSGTNYILPLTPFDSIQFTLDYAGLFPPYLGTFRYTACAKGILDLITHIIPSTLSPTLNVLIDTVRSESGNGYDLLYRILKTFVPGFNKSNPISLPYWTSDTTVYEYSTSIVLYFRIQALHQSPFSDYDKSLTFLRGVTGSEYIELTHSLISTVENFYLDNSNGELGWLPERLRIPALSTRLNSFAQRRMMSEIPHLQSSLVPYARRTTPYMAYDQLPHHLPFDVPFPEAVTHQPQAFRAFTDNKHRGGVTFNDKGRRGTYNSNNSTTTTTSLTGTSTSTLGGTPTMKSPGRPSPNRAPGRPRPFPDPTRNRRPFVNQQCAACGKVGHTWQHCDMLAMAITTHRFMEGQASQSTLTGIESDWLARHRARLQDDSRSPRQVLRAYADTTQLSLDDIDDQLDWATWDDADADDLTHADHQE